MKVYIAGKITGLKMPFVILKFLKTKLILKKEGHSVMSPSVLGFNAGFEHSDYMHICFAMIDVCDAIYMQKDWVKSKGAKMELDYAKKHKKQIFYENERL
ncbi:DUF4406 domain-containing protein [Treponema pectinovorum]|uniref:DUF4406 domain-containing protein n=1 Tax=Treponema pectinovorum TaxID=164 RepID=UPI0011CADA27|nr:DUF4406 domain-containing protein [Treponema pectinovorum]